MTGGLYNRAALSLSIRRNIMNHTAELEKALTDLKRITGISMDVHAETEEEVTKALEQLKLLSSAYKEKYNKIHFLQSLMRKIQMVNSQSLCNPFRIASLIFDRCCRNLHADFIYQRHCFKSAGQMNQFLFP